MTEPDPPENCQLTVKKLPKTWHFFQKIFIFSIKLPMENFEKKCQVFVNFWHSNVNFPEGQLYCTLYRGTFECARYRAAFIPVEIAPSKFSSTNFCSHILHHWKQWVYKSTIFIHRNSIIDHIIFSLPSGSSSILNCDRIVFLLNTFLDQSFFQSNDL